jgi:alkylation response protein AidB-like acyl-CoA dehydrogenase
MTIPSENILTVSPIASLSDEVNDIRQRTAKIVAEYVIPQEKVLAGLEGEDKRDSLYEELRNHTQGQGLWKPHLPTEYGGMGAGFLSLAYMNEIMAWSPFSKSCFGIVPPSAGKLEDKQFIQGFIADSYMDIQAARLMTIHTAEVIESGRDPRTDIFAIKVFVPAAMHRVVDRAIQTFGGIGVSSDYPLAGFYLAARTLRIADGPDEVHKILIAKNILKQYHSGHSWDFG